MANKSVGLQRGTRSHGHCLPERRCGPSLTPPGASAARPRWPPSGVDAGQTGEESKGIGQFHIPC